MEVNKKTPLKIPLDKIDEGIALCVKNALEFCSDAEHLVKKGSCEHALGLCILAVEEFGKAKMLKEKSAIARSENKDAILFEKVKPELFFRGVNREALLRMGFKNKKIHPFYDHLSKLLSAMPMMQIAVHDRIMKSLEGRQFQTIDEIFAKANKLRRGTQEPSKDLREAVFYVHYYQKERKWRKGVEIDQTNVEELISDIRESIRLFSS